MKHGKKVQYAITLHTNTAIELDRQAHLQKMPRSRIVEEALVQALGISIRKPDSKPINPNPSSFSQVKELGIKPPDPKPESAEDLERRLKKKLKTVARFKWAGRPLFR